jgi:hypothetical protein
VAISGNQWQSVAISGNQWQSGAHDVEGPQAAVDRTRWVAAQEEEGVPQRDRLVKVLEEISFVDLRSLHL